MLELVCQMAMVRFDLLVFWFFGPPAIRQADHQDHELQLVIPIEFVLLQPSIPKCEVLFRDGLQRTQAVTQYLLFHHHWLDKFRARDCH